MRRLVLLALLAPALAGCQMGYYVKSAYNHFSMMSKRVPVDEALKDPNLSPENRAKLQAAKDAHDFALSKMALKETANYTSYVELGRPYVSWVVSAAPRWRLEHHEWKYPFVGKMPYKGYASEEDARGEQRDLEKRELDTFLRGVSAYSTLGWFQDSILSSMLRASEHDLVNTIIHETTHTTIYIRNSSDFNERLAVFAGNKGAEQFYLAKEGADSKTVRTIADENADDRTFSEFIGPQLKSLREWYEALPENDRDENKRRARFAEIQAEFKKSVLPRMRTKTYARFPEIELNNARLLYYKTYMEDLSDFEALFRQVQGDWPAFWACAKTLEKTEKPDRALKELNARLVSENSSRCP